MSCKDLLVILWGPNWCLLDNENLKEWFLFKQNVVIVTDVVKATDNKLDLDVVITHLVFREQQYQFKFLVYFNKGRA